MDESVQNGSMSDLEQLLNQMNEQPAEQTATEEPKETVSAEPSTDKQEAQPQQPPKETPQPQPQATAKPTQNAKMNFAFGQMRTELDNYKSLLAKLASASGIQYSDDKDLITKLNDDALAKLATRQNVPVDLLKRLEMLENNNAQYAAAQRQADVMMGFQKLANTYGLTNEELTAFATELDQKGLNPLRSNINIEMAYKDLHFEDIMTKRVDAAVQAALKKSSVADTHSSTPDKAVGKNASNGETKKINSVSDLTDFLNAVK